MSSPANEPPRAHILVVEDSSVFREMQGLLLGQAGYGVSAHENPCSALEAAAKQHFDLVVIDYELPEMNGQQFMHALRRIQPDIAVVFVSGSLTLELAIQLSSQGVAGIFNKPANPKTLLEKINETLARNAVRDTAARTGSSHPLSRASADPLFAAREPATDQVAYPPRYLLGQSDSFREFSHRLWKVRDFRAVLLLQGEAGSPFELIARDLAEISLFREGPIMVCGAESFEPRSLIETLAPCLLSHDAGTLIVSGVERFTSAQQKTLENLISGRDVFLPFARRFRVVLAATAELGERVDHGTFNETLFYKVSSLSLTVPALREMRGDIALNTERIFTFQRDAGYTGMPSALHPDAAAWLEQQEWPGNYEQLAAVVLTAVQFTDGTELTLPALEEACRQMGAFTPIPLATPPPQSGDDGETRPPFPLMSDLAGEAIPALSIGAAPASSLASSLSFGAKPKSATPAPVINVQSLFRPASSAYRFDERLALTLVAAETPAA